MKTVQKHLQLLTFLLIFIVSMFIRFWHMEYIPYQTDGDEVAYVFAGQSLLEFGTPVSWSGFSYPKEDVYGKIKIGNFARGTEGEYNLVKPWFDHPFLLPVIEGYTLHAAGYHFSTVPPSFIIRLPMLMLAGGTLILTYLISKELFGNRAALFSMALMGFTPSLAFGQRMVIGENLYIPMMLFAIYCVLKKYHLSTYALLSVLAGLSKITGLITIPIIVVALALQGKYKLMLQYVVFSLGVFGGIYMLYGFVHGWHEFVSLFRNQSYRLLGWSNPAFIFSHPGFHTKPILDAGYYLLLLFGIAPFFSKLQRNHAWLFFAILFCFSVVWGTSAEQDMLGWYKLPLFAFLSIASGAVIQAEITLPTSLLIYIAAFNNIGLARFVKHPLPSVETLRMAIGILLLLGFGFIWIKNKTISQKLQKGVLIASFAFYATVSLWTASKYYEALCESKSCPTPELTFRQVLKTGFTH